jgi:hypothetical protein
MKRYQNEMTKRLHCWTLLGTLVGMSAAYDMHGGWLCFKFWLAKAINYLLPFRTAVKSV